MLPISGGWPQLGWKEPSVPVPKIMFSHVKQTVQDQIGLAWKKERLISEQEIGAGSALAKGKPACLLRTKAPDIWAERWGSQPPSKEGVHASQMCLGAFVPNRALWQVDLAPPVPQMTHK